MWLSNGSKNTHNDDSRRIERRMVKKKLNLVFRKQCINAHVRATQKAHTYTVAHVQVLILDHIMFCSHQNVMNGSSLAVHARAFVCLVNTSAARWCWWRWMKAIHIKHLLWSRCRVRTILPTKTNLYVPQTFFYASIYFFRFYNQ